MKHTTYKKSKTTMLLLAFVLCAGFSGFAQTLKISGTVSGDGQPLPGVSILEKGTANGVVSDFDGNYEITAKADGVLIFSYIGYAVQEVPVNGKATVNVSLTEDVAQLDEVVLIGYGAQKKKELTGAVAQVKSESIENISTSDVGNALQGQVAGVNVTSSSGQPGDNAQILIRGINSVFGSNEPLFVVDGIPQDGNPQLSVAEIETIDVLKDAASAAIYGTRGSAGVILITTKTGKVGKMNIGLRSFYGVQDIISSIPLLDFNDFWYAEFWRINNNFPGRFQNNAWTPLEQNPFNFTNNTNIMDLLQVDMASIQQHSVNISGGKEGLTYNVSMNYFDQEGSLINSGLQRLNIRGNTRYKKDRWTLTTGLGIRTDEQRFTPFRVLLDGYRYMPYQNFIDPTQEIIDDGDLNENDLNALGYFTAKLKRTDVRNGDNFNFNTQARYEISKTMNLTARVGLNRTNYLRVRVDPVFNTYDQNGDLRPPQIRSGVYNQNQRMTSQTVESIFNYDNDFGHHNLKFTAVASAEKYTNTSFFAQKFDLISNESVTLNGATLDPNVGTGNGWMQDRENTLIGLLGRMQYNYKGKYFLSASIRQDGSSRFAKENRWIYAPSASAAWVISEEPGFEQNFGDTINFFKLRGSFGTTGNQSIADYSTQPTISLGHDYIFGGGNATEDLALGAIQRDFKNPLAQWEKKVEYNFGVDFGMFNNKLTITTEVYEGSRTNMLFPVILPPSVGTNATTGALQSVILNIGDMRNYGSEVSVNYKHKGQFKWDISANYSTNKNEVTRMSEYNKFSFLSGSQVAPGLPNEDLVTALREGYPAGSFFLIETDGIVRTQEELDAYKLLEPTAKLGDLRYVDQLTVDTDGDGIPDAGDGTITIDDRVYKGNGLPEYELGLSFNAEYKRFDFSMIWYAAMGGEIINGSKAYAYKQGTHQDLVHQWTPANPLSNIPAYRGRDHQNMRGYTDFWLQDGSFARLKNITLGYSLPRSFTNKLKINKLRFYLSADNLLTITNYDGFDPEIGGDGLNTRGIDAGVYPVSTQYRAGLLLNF